MALRRPFGEFDLDHHRGLDPSLAARLSLRPTAGFHLIGIKRGLGDLDLRKPIVQLCPSAHVPAGAATPGVAQRLAVVVPEQQATDFALGFNV